MAKIPELSIYNKIWTILDKQRVAKADSVAELIEAIESAKPPSFVYRRRDKAGAWRRNVCLPTTVESAIALCQHLELLDPSTCRLTNVGLSASDHRQFDRVLGKQIEKYLEKHNASLTSIKKTIRESLLHANPPIMPGSEEIHQRLGTTITLHGFRRLLNLLGLCGGLHTCQRKLYLP